MRSSPGYLAVFLTYFLVGHIGLAVPFTSGNVSPIWPSAGVAVAAFLMFGNRMWAAVFAAAFAVNFSSGIPALHALGMGIGNTLGPLAAAALFLKIGFDPQLRRLRDLLGLIATSVLTGTAISATIGVTTLSFAGVHAWSSIAAAWLIWWLGDAMGVLLITPLLVTSRRIVLELRGRRLAEFSLLVLLTAVSSVALFDDRVGFHLAEDLLAFALFPFILWGAIRFQVAGAALASCVIAAVTIVETAFGFGPFVRQSSALHNAAVLQAFIGVISLSGLALAVVIQEKEDTQEALRRQTQRLVDTVSHRLQLAQQAADIGAWEWNLQSGTITWSEELELMHGFSAGGFDGNYETWASTVHPDDRQWVQKEVLAAVEQNRSYDVEYRSVRPDGTTYWTAARGRVLPDESGAPERLVGICMNIDQRKLAEQALRNSEKLAATGRLAATMAHEINNPLEAITNLLYLARNVPELSGELREYLAVADEELRRVGHIAKRTLAFYRDTGCPVEMDLGEATDEVLGIFRRKIESKHVNVVKEYAQGIRIKCNSGEIRQVLSNVILNAIDAVAHNGTVHIRVSKSRAGKNGVRVLIADSGPGITRDDKVRIFEPFFTTKKDVGTGLGLWISRAIVEKHGGSIRIRSSVVHHKRGTTVSILLPNGTVSAASN
jgi:PAS domain S-box-containing protein